MTETTTSRGILRRDSVRMITQPALVECGGRNSEHAGTSISVVPLLDGKGIAGFEVRCGCGSSAVVECVYPNEA